MRRIMPKIDKFKMDGNIIDWNDELIKISKLDLTIALRCGNPEDRDRLVSLAKKTLVLVGCTE